MIQWLRSKWKVLLRDAAIALCLVMGIQWWQNRSLRSTEPDLPTVAMQLVDTSGFARQVGGATASGQVLFFFAPWCGVCHMTIGNFAWVKEWLGDGGPTFVNVGLDYESTDELVGFMDEHKLSYATVAGDEATRNAYKISAYPTFYILNETGQIVSRGVGYTTTAGLLARIWLWL